MKIIKILLTILIIVGLGILSSCTALKKSICGTETLFDTVTYENHFYDTIPVLVEFNDTIAYVGTMYRDTIPVFKGINIFIGSSVDSVSLKDSLRYYQFEIRNYGSENYIPTSNSYLNMIADVAIKNVIYRSDTIKINEISSGSSRYFTLKYPITWFMSDKSKPWNYSSLDLQYNYRLTITNQDWDIKDAYYSKTLNKQPPIIKYDEVTKDSIIYWVRPIVKDTTITIKHIGYAFKDSLIFIDDMVGCNIFAHTFFGNRIYNFTVDTCMKIICSNEIINNPNTEGISDFFLKAYSNVDTARLRVYINDSLIGVEKNAHDSMFIYLIRKSSKDIKSIKFESNNDWIIKKVVLNNSNLLINPSVTVTGIININGTYKVLAPIVVAKNPLVAQWKFNGNSNDETGKYPLTVTDPTNMFNTNNGTNGSAEGTGNISFQGSDYYINAGVIPITDEFSFCFWFQTWNPSSNIRPQFGNSMVDYPNGYICLLDEINKGVKFCTGNGTMRNFILSNDNLWTVGKWIHVVITGSRITGTGKIYINGVDKTRASSTGIFKTFSTTFPLLLGRSTDPNQAWSYMDDFRIYNRILTPAEVVQVYKLETI
jgi:hypothetical protein